MMVHKSQVLDLLNPNVCNIFCATSKGPFSRAVLCYFLPFAGIRVGEQTLAEVMLNNFLLFTPSFPLICLWTSKWPTGFNDPKKTIRSWVQWSHIWGRGKRMVILCTNSHSQPFLMPGTMCVANIQINFTARCIMTKIRTSKFHWKLTKTIWEDAWLYLHGRQKTVHVLWSLDVHM